MTPALRRMLALWAICLAAIVCFCFLPVSRLMAVLLMLWIVAGAVILLWFIRRQTGPAEVIDFPGLPDASYRQPVVLCCGDLPQNWPGDKTILTVSQGCWIRIGEDQDLCQAGRQLLAQRPEWGPQLSVMVTVCPQHYEDSETLTSRLLAIRWQLSQLRRTNRQAIPLILNGQVGSEMISAPLWQGALLELPVSVWPDASAPCAVSDWVASTGTPAMQQQILMNSLVSWFAQFVEPTFTASHPDIPAIVPAAVLWTLRHDMDHALPGSLWTGWLQQHTALQQVKGWQPAAEHADTRTTLPEFILPLLPEGNGITPRQRTARNALSLFTVSAIVALGCSGWNNHQLLQRVAFDIGHYYRIAMDDYVPKAEAVKALRQDAAQLDHWARNGAPTYLGLGLYQGGRLHMPVLDAIRSYVPPPPPPPPPKPEPAPKIVRLDSMSLFDSGKSALKAGSLKILVNSLVDIKAKPGWLIVVAGHTDNTGNPKLNQTLSQKRAESVRDWMRDTGDVPESCFAVQGYGESRPVATNDTPEGRALNRRVEISLVPQADACQLPGNPETSSPDDDDYDNEMEK